MLALYKLEYYYYYYYVFEVTVMFCVVMFDSWISCSVAALLNRGRSSTWWNPVVQITAIPWTRRRSSVCLRSWPSTTHRSSVCFYSLWLGHRDCLSAVSDDVNIVCHSSVVSSLCVSQWVDS